MVDLEKRISGDWIELKQKAGDYRALVDMLHLSPSQLGDAASKLRLSVEQGIIEFKRSMVSPVMGTLENARYKSLTAEEIIEQERSLTALLFAILVQRLLATDMLPRGRAQEEQKDLGVDAVEVNTMISAVKTMIGDDPALRSHPAVKNILVQMQVYNKENQKLRELLPTIRPEMRASFLANFKKTFDGIVGSIRRNYEVLLQEQVAQSTNQRQGFSPASLPLKDLAPLLATQAREVSRIRSTLTHAREEKYKTREVLVRLYDSRQQVLGLFEDELKAYQKLCKDALQADVNACAKEIAVSFRDQIVSILEKESRRDQPKDA